MSLIPWLPERAGGVNLFDDASSLPPHQLVQCDNYYPHGRRWRSLPGNSTFVSAGKADRVRHLDEYQIDDGALGTTKELLSFESDGKIYATSTGARVQLTGVTYSTSQTLLWDTATFIGIKLIANGSDNLSETSNGTTLTTTAGSPPSAPQYVTAWKNRVFLFGRAAAPLTVNFCADGDRTTWTGSDTGTEIITSTVGDFGTGMKAVENYLALFTRRTITLLVGDHPDNWTKRTVYEDGGCISHRTIQKINGGLVFANDFGVYLLNADGKRQELSRDIRPYWQNKEGNATQRNTARGKFMHAVFDPTPDNLRYIIFLAEGTSTKEDVAAIYHFNQDAWTFLRLFMDSGQTCQASALREDTSGNIQPYIATGSDDITTADKKIYKMDNSASFASLTGGSIAATLKTGILAGQYIPQLREHGLAAVSRYLNIYTKYTDDPTTGNLTFAFSSAHKATLQAQKTVNMAYGGSGNISRQRVPIALEGWGLQIKVSHSDSTTAHDFMGGMIETEEKGTV